MEQAPSRALLLLRAVALDADIARAMRRTGFDDAELRRGWRLLQAACGAPSGRARAAPTATRPVAPPARAANRDIDRFAATTLRRARAAVRRAHPDHESFLFGPLQGARGSGAVAAVAIFLERCDELASSKPAGRAVLETLARRGVTPAARRQAAAWVKTAMQRAPEPVAPVEPTDASRALEALYEWVRDWSACARTEITRRDWLIRLGIGRRHAR